MHILVVEDSLETRQWLQTVIVDAFPDARIKAANSVKEGLSICLDQQFQIALIDLGLPDGSGIEVLSYLRQHHPDTQCVVMSVLGDDLHIVNALAGGAEGYLVKEQPKELIIHQLRQLRLGIPALSPSIARRLMAHFQSTRSVATIEHNLTEREKQVLLYIGQGLRNGEVAKQLEIAESTVASHIKSIYHKLGISSRAEAAQYANHLGLNYYSVGLKIK